MSTTREELELSEITSSAHRVSLVHELRQAIESDALSLLFQPKLDLASNRVTEAEALVRWKHPTMGHLPPERFVGPAERAGDIHRLTGWVLERAMQQSAAWHEQGIELGVAVNISALDLFDTLLPQRIEELLERWSLFPECLLLEITESTVARDTATADWILMQLAGLGIRTSIDDFGTGYSSLGQLRSLPVHEVKLDKCFVTGLPQSRQDEIIVRSTIELIHSLRLRVVAEGVESAETLSLLRDMGCDMAQGFYLSRPLTARDVTAWMKNSSDLFGDPR